MSTNAQGNTINALALTFSTLALAVSVGLFVSINATSALTASVSPQAFSAAQAPQISPSPCQPVTPAQAITLLKQHFPNMTVNHTAPARFGDHNPACLLEVDITADKNNPMTQGLVYVMPDGEHFLNGPLMNSQSQIALAIPAETKEKTPITNTQGAENTTGFFSELSTLDDLISSLSPDERESFAADIANLKALMDEADSSSLQKQSNTMHGYGFMDEQMPRFVTGEYPTPDPAFQKADAIKGGFLRVQHMPDLLDSTIVQYMLSVPEAIRYHEERPGTILVAYDPQCPFVSAMFKNQDEIAEKHDSKIIWVPVYRNSFSLDILAQIEHIRRQDPDRAREVHAHLLSTRTWDANNLRQTYGAPSYELRTQIEKRANPIINYLVDNDLATPTSIIPMPNARPIVVRGFSSLEKYSASIPF